MIGTDVLLNRMIEGIFSSDSSEAITTKDIAQK